MASTYPPPSLPPSLCPTNSSCSLPLRRLWIPAHVVNFAFVPNRQVGRQGVHAGACCGAVVWTVPGCCAPGCRASGQRRVQVHHCLWRAPCGGGRCWQCSDKVPRPCLIHCLQRILYANVISIAGEHAV